MDYNYHLTYVGFSDPEADRSILKDSMSRYRTNLFLEFNTTRHETMPPLYTMREEPYKGLPSAYLIYMTSDSEYEAAMKLVGSWNHWQRLLKCKPFMEGPEDAYNWTGLNAWREEKAVKDKAEAYNQLKISAAQGNVQAQKLLYEADKQGTKRGRPSKDEVRKAAAAEAERDQRITNDLKRLKAVN
jgi:hypothetical protein